MVKNTGDFYFFNYNLCNKIKELSYAKVLPLIRDDYTKFDSHLKKMSDAFSDYSNAIYIGPNKLKSFLTCRYYDENSKVIDKGFVTH